MQTYGEQKNLTEDRSDELKKQIRNWLATSAIYEFSIVFTDSEGEKTPSEHVVRICSKDGSGCPAEILPGESCEIQCQSPCANFGEIPWGGLGK